MDNNFANNFNLLADEIKRRHILTEYLTPAAKKGYICLCGNGSGDDGTGAVISKDGNRLLCGKCLKGYSNIDIIARHLGISTTGKDFIDVVKFGCQLFGLSFNDAQGEKIMETKTPKQPVQPVQSFERLAEAQKNLPAFLKSQGGKWRGLTLDTLQRLKCGFLPSVYFPAAEKELPAVVIPNDSGGVYFRSIQGKFHKNNKPMATTTIFLPDTDNFDIIITEGQLNAASIFQAIFGFTNHLPNFGIIACSGTSGENLILHKLQQLKEHGKKFNVILAFDNDTSNAGKIAADKILAALIKAGYSACTFDFINTPDTDFNDILRQDNGNKKLANLLFDAVALAQEKLVAAQENAKHSIFGENIYDYFTNQFQADIADNEKFKDRKTGFDNFDDALNFFLPGVYVFSGLPALGKTTFCLQLLEQMAQNGNHCIFCSFEMSKKFLYSKILARKVFQIESQRLSAVKFPLSTTKIFVNDINDFHEDYYQYALKFFTTTTYPFFIWEETSVDVDGLINRLRNVCSNLSKPPIVCIDYLQLLGAGADNPKSAIDNALQKFFNFRRETNTTFILISSINRANYNTDANFAGLKESGGIEYSADGIFFLQYLLNERTAKDTEQAMKKIPREVQLKCLKYRFGSQFDIGFFYYPNVDTFLPMLDYGAYTDYTNNSSTADGEFADEK